MLRSPLPRHGPGVVLRRLRGDDLGDFQAYRHDEEVGAYQGWSSQPDARALEFLERMSVAPLFAAGTWTQVAIAAADSPRLLGDIGVFIAEDSQTAEIGFTLCRAAQGRGIATAAVAEALSLVFETTAVKQVVGITDARNVRCVRLLERLGFSRESQRDEVFRGKPCLEYVYVIRRVLR
jgi:RimJ/RimL family protein N-acetyltransferase